MPVTTTALNAMMSTLATNAPYLSLHSADPGATGLNPTTGARQAASWSVAANGIITSANKVFTGGVANGVITHVGLWSAVTGGTFYGSFPVTGDAQFNSAGSYTLTSFSLSNATA